MRAYDRSISLSVALLAAALFVSRAEAAVTIAESPLPTANSFPVWIAAGSDGNLWFTEYCFFDQCALGPLGGPALDPNQLRSFPFAGACGIPSDALVVSGNVTVVVPSAGGNFRVDAADRPVPPTSVINFSTGKTRGNNLSVALSHDGNQSVAIQNDSLGTAGVVFDVNGYFK